eukprot:TRINITY_DN3756_c0_g1_i1.p1 TRINITY_DN3756_c0_g1~~TRINITY_DN3756_c0_g1_i1.p1  ORF type:complete len:445 (+),score=98.96 TRINITY_DN3756_c0_g1_i1:36-1337(+)
MAAVSFLPKAIDFVKQALEQDEAANYPEAFRLYSISLEYFLTALKYETNEKRKTTIRDKTAEYLARAEQIKQIMDSGQSNTDENGGGGSASKKKGDKDVEKEEKAKMRGNMQSSIISNVPDVQWDDVAGLFMAKEALKEAVILPHRFPHMFVGKRKPWTGILLYGPPGTGKSYLAQAVATEAKCTFFSVSSADLVSKWLGESEKQVRMLFEMSRENRPAVIFIDEIDSLAGARGEGDSESSTRIKTEFLVQMNGLGNDMDGVLVLAATNMPWNLDPAIRRRFEKRIYIPLPTASARSQIFKIHLGDTPNTLTPQQFQELGEATEGYSGSDIKTCVREALMMPVRIVQNATHFKKVRGPDRTDPTKIRDYLTPCSPGDPAGMEMTWMDLEGEELMEPALTASHFQQSIRNTRPSVGPEDIQEHVKWTAEFGQDG